jgi:hypothetical protein
VDGNFFQSLWLSCDIDDKDHNLKFGVELQGSEHFALHLISGGKTDTSILYLSQ